MPPHADHDHDAVGLLGPGAGARGPGAAADDVLVGGRHPGGGDGSRRGTRRDPGAADVRTRARRSSRSWSSVARGARSSTTIAWTCGWMHLAGSRCATRSIPRPIRRVSRGSSGSACRASRATGRSSTCASRRSSATPPTPRRSTFPAGRARMTSRLSSFPRRVGYLPVTPTAPGDLTLSSAVVPPGDDPDTPRSVLLYTDGMAYVRIGERPDWSGTALFGPVGPAAQQVDLAAGGVAYYEPAGDGHRPPPRDPRRGHERVPRIQPPPRAAPGAGGIAPRPWRSAPRRVADADRLGHLGRAGDAGGRVVAIADPGGASRRRCPPDTSWRARRSRPTPTTGDVVGVTFVFRQRESDAAGEPLVLHVQAGHMLPPASSADQSLVDLDGHERPLDARPSAARVDRRRRLPLARRRRPISRDARSRLGLRARSRRCRAREERPEGARGAGGRPDPRRHAHARGAEPRRAACSTRRPTSAGRTPRRPARRATRGTGHVPRVGARRAAAGVHPSRSAASRLIDRLTSVAEDNVWMTRSWSSDGALVDHPTRPYAIPIDAAAVSPRSFGAFLPPPDRGDRRGAGGRPGCAGRDVGGAPRSRDPAPSWRSRAARASGSPTSLPDELVGAAELLVSKETGATIGVHRERYLLLQPRDGGSVTSAELRARLRPLLPADLGIYRRVQVRAPGETPYLPLRRRGAAAGA